MTDRQLAAKSPTILFTIVSVPAHMRGRINSRKSYVRRCQLMQVVSRGVVERSSRRSLSTLGKTMLLVGSRGWQDYSIAGEKGGRTIDPDVAPVSAAFGVLCMPGPGAWFGLRDSGQPHRAPS